MQGCANYDLTDPDDLARVKPVIELYRGDYLAGFYENWALIEIEHYRRVYLNALHDLIEYCAHVDLNQLSIMGSACWRLTPSGRILTAR